ncbi:MAG TPA: LysR family transcriptional regulator [Acetobacteraceae bacterium]|nr:LysR family transcriptional regulator [Acetobacteraceae bacterium]
MSNFVAAVETGSLSAAARALQVTQPAASQQVKELERALSARLLQRGGGRVRLTAAGEAVLAQARRVQAAMDDLVAAAAAFQGGEAGRLRLGTGATACIHLLPPVLARMKQHMPGLDIIIATGNTADMLQRVLAGDLDLALVTLSGRLDRALEARRLLEEPLVAYAQAAMLPAEAALGPAQLAALPLILYESGGATRGVVDAWFRRGGAAPRPIMELGSVEAIKILAESGLGATILPSGALRAPGSGMAVRALRPAATRSLAVVLRRDKVRDRGLRVGLELLTASALGMGAGQSHFRTGPAAAPGRCHPSRPA